MKRRAFFLSSPRPKTVRTIAVPAFGNCDSRYSAVNCLVETI